MARRFWFVTLCAALALIGLLVGMMVHLRVRAASSRLPERGQTVARLAGLSADVEVRFDERGIAHIRAPNERALWFAAGYVQARDRFFQMDLMRRMAQGRLSEIFGPRTVAVDRKMRILRVAASARRQSSQLEVAERWALDEYTAGINAALGQYGRWISPESWLLGLEPDPWQREDTLAIGLLYQLSMSPAMGEELKRAVELARLGQETALDLWGWSPDEANRWIPPAPPISTPRQNDEAIIPESQPFGSSAWAVAAAKTTGGRPLLASDPHLGVSMPGFFYAIHLECPEIHVAGLAMPGTPGVMIGHNEHVAWGLAEARVDDQDLYILTLDETRDRELIDGEWQDLRTVSERINVRWQDEAEVVKILLSERGPVVRERGREVLALEWTGLRARSSLGAVLEMDRARTVSDVIHAWHDVSGPFYQVVAADSEGRIVQFFSGSLPDRPRGNGRLPSPGQESAWAWQGMVPLSDALTRLDPEDGIVAAANHDVFTEGDYGTGVRVPGEFAGPWRIRRIRRELSSRDDWQIGDFVRLQGDVTSDLAVALMRQLRPEMDHHGGPAAATLAGWDGRMSRDSEASHLYSRLLLELTDAVGGDDAARDGLPSSPVGTTALLRLLAGGMDESWWDDVGTDVVESRAMIVDRVFDRLDAERIGSPWGAVHRVTFHHPYGKVPVVGAWLGRSWSRGPYPLGGDGTTINANSWRSENPFTVTECPQGRIVVEVGRWDDTVLVLPTGQSGRPWSPHYADQLDAWLHVKPQTFPFSKEAVDAASVAQLLLLTADDAD